MGMFHRKQNLSYTRNFKGLSPFTTPFGKRRFIGIVDSKISKGRILSRKKSD
jgi:hypothetical protein